LWLKNEKEAKSVESNLKRNQEIYQRMLAGETLKQLSARFGLCQERIRQLGAMEHKKAGLLRDGSVARYVRNKNKPRP
jgi:DNA-directed RNA polymerase sigma subunit (sigma70/sigma32)